MSIKSKLLKIGLGVIGLNTFTACYGPALPPPDVSRLVFGGRVVNEGGLPVAGIKISRYGQQYAETDRDGLFEFPVYLVDEEVKDTLHFSFHDSDKAADGSYRDMVVVADFSHSTDCIGNEVVMVENK